jgi:hypothetical protein
MTWIGKVFKTTLWHLGLKHMKFGWCQNAKEYHLKCHKHIFIAHSNQKNFRFLINYQDITKMEY